MADLKNEVASSDPRLAQVLAQLHFSEIDSTSALPTSTEGSVPTIPGILADTSDTWTKTYKTFRKPRSVSTWQWSTEKRPGKYCDHHLLDFFSCIDKTKDKLESDDVPEKFCLAAQELTTACMVHTLCEDKIFEVTASCSEQGSPRLRSQDCWYKLWAAQNCVQHSQTLLSRPYWATRPDLVSTSERYMLLLGSPNVPGKPILAADHVERRKEFLQNALETGPKLQPGDIPYNRGLHSR